jgi:hypothetical protein
MHVFEDSIDDYGNAYKAIWFEEVPHTQKQCDAFSALEKETWPTLW